MANRLLLGILFWFVLLSPVWIRIASNKSWRLSTKRISIVILVIISATTTIYGFLRPQANPSSWSTIGGKVILMAYLAAVLLSAYFNWPRESRKSGKSLFDNPRRKSTAKNRTYVSIPLMTGSDGAASVTFLNATFQIGNGAQKRYPAPDFGAWLIDQIYNVNKIMAERRGVFKKKLFCPSCGTELSPEHREPKQIALELRYVEFDPFILQINIPSISCPQCNRICGIDSDGSLNNHLSEAILAAFRSENIKP